MSVISIVSPQNNNNFPKTFEYFLRAILWNSQAKYEMTKNVDSSSNFECSLQVYSLKYFLTRTQRQSVVSGDNKFCSYLLRSV